MNTLKSAAVILVLAGVLYGVYIALNKPEAGAPPGATAQLQSLGPPQIEMTLPGHSAPPTTHLPAPPTSLAGIETGSPADLTPAEPTNRQSSYDSPERAAGGAFGTPLAADTTIPATTPAVSPVNALSFRRDVTQAEQQVAEGKFRQALTTLSPYYSLPELTSEERQQLLVWLDALAAKVIYSREHLLDTPHFVQGKQENLRDIADKNHVPWQLLANINGVANPDVLLPGTELKIVPGPLRADVNLTTSEVTLFLNDLYAGRFPFSLGNEPPQPGEYRVLRKEQDRTYYGSPDGRPIPANDPRNPYGKVWLDLGREACIHGSPDSPSSQTLGCISLHSQDAQDIFCILATGSAVSIRR